MDNAGELLAVLASSKMHILLMPSLVELTLYIRSQAPRLSKRKKRVAGQSTTIPDFRVAFFFPSRSTSESGSIIIDSAGFGECFV